MASVKTADIRPALLPRIFRILPISTARSAGPIWVLTGVRGSIHPMTSSWLMDWLDLQGAKLRRDNGAVPPAGKLAGRRLAKPGRWAAPREFKEGVALLLRASVGRALTTPGRRLRVGSLGT